MSFQPNRIKSVLENIPSVSPGQAMSSAFNLFGKDAGTSIIALLVLIIMYAFVALVDNYILEANILENVFSWFVAPILSAGWLYIAHNIKHHEKATLSDLFAAFSDGALKIIGLNILVGIITMIAVAIPFGLLLSNLLVDYFSSGMDNSIFLDFEGYFFNTNGLLALLFAMILGFYFSAAYFLAVPFLVFYKMGVWEAMEASRKVFNKNVFSYLVIFILLILLNIGGTIAILVGLLVTIPISAYVTYTVFAQVADLPDDDEDGLLEELQED